MNGTRASDQLRRPVPVSARAMPWRWHVRAFALAVSTSALATTVQAAAPVIDYLYPAGGRQGTAVTVTVGAAKGDAKIAPWPATVWTDSPGLTFKPGDANGTFVVEIAGDAALGPHLVRVYNEDGASAPRVFVVDRHPEELEKETSKEPNDDAHAAQAVAQLPAVLNGRLEKAGDVDSWSVEVEAGHWLVAELNCRRLGAPVDPSMQLLDPKGTVVAFAHDTFGLDPLLAHRAPRSGRYVLQLSGFAHPPGSDVRFAGSKANSYRVIVTTGPYARHAFPACVARGKRTSVRLFGWNLDAAEGEGLAVEVDSTQAPATANKVVVTDPRIDNVLRLLLADLPGKPELEPNDASDRAQALEAPAAIDGRLERPGDVDRFAVSAKKGEKLTASVRAATLGSPIDAVLTVADAGAKQLARADDDAAGGHDAQLQWTAPADGTYVITLADLTGRGGPECAYRLEVARPGAELTATTDTHAFRVEPSKSADIKLTLTRQAGDDTPLGVTVAGLPEGVTAITPDVPAKGGAVTVTLKAAADAEPANQPFRVMVVAKEDKRPAERAAVFALGQDQLIEYTSSLWLTVARPAKGK